MYAVTYKINQSCLGKYLHENTHIYKNNTVVRKIMAVLHLVCVKTVFEVGDRA